MFKYIVTWVIAVTTSIPCPDAGKVDEFGIGNDFTTSCSVYHFETTSKTKVKEFRTRDSALAFYNRGKDRTHYLTISPGSAITEIKIDSFDLIDHTKKITVYPRKIPNIEDCNCSCHTDHQIVHFKSCCKED